MDRFDTLIFVLEDEIKFTNPATMKFEPIIGLKNMLLQAYEILVHSSMEDFEARLPRFQKVRSDLEKLEDTFWHLQPPILLGDMLITWV